MTLTRARGRKKRQRARLRLCRAARRLAHGGSDTLSSPQLLLCGRARVTRAPSCRSACRAPPPSGARPGLHAHVPRLAGRRVRVGPRAHVLEPLLAPWIRYGTILHTEPLSLTFRSRPAHLQVPALGQVPRVDLGHRVQAHPAVLLDARLGRRGVLPSASAVPANIEPHIAALAPSLERLPACPEFWIPPSAKMGTPN